MSHLEQPLFSIPGPPTLLSDSLMSSQESSMSSVAYTPPPPRRPSFLTTFRYVTPKALGRTGYARWVGSQAWHMEGEGTACTTSPGYCLYATCCPCCASFSMRRALLLDDVSNYKCCAGVWCPGHCDNTLDVGGGSWVCLALETLACLAISVHANRYVLQQHYHLEPSACDDITHGCATGWCPNCCGADAETWAPCCTMACVVPCLLTQQHYEMEVCGYPRNMRGLGHPLMK